MIPISSNRSSSRNFYKAGFSILPIVTKLRLSSEIFTRREAKHPYLQVFRASKNLSESKLQVMNRGWPYLRVFRAFLVRTSWLGFFNLTIFFIFLYIFMRFSSFPLSSFFFRPGGSERMLVFITFTGFDVQVWCLQSFCSKFNGGSDRLLRFWIRSVFRGQNTWKAEREFCVTLVFGNFFMKGKTFSKNVVP